MEVYTILTNDEMKKNLTTSVVQGRSYVQKLGAGKNTKRLMPSEEDPNWECFFFLSQDCCS